MKIKARFALLSVYEKKGIEKLASTLQKAGVGILATGGTEKFLRENGLTILPIEKVAGTREIFDGRVKTMSAQVLGGILFDRNSDVHRNDAKKHHIPQIDFVVCNFYPFSEKPDLSMIDIGGPALVRAAAKNFHNVTVLVDPNDYEIVAREISQSGNINLKTKKLLASKAFSYVLNYDALIDEYFQSKTEVDGLTHTISMDRGRVLRYGENPHQRGFFFQEKAGRDPLSLGKFKMFQGKAPSFNNFLDVSAGIEVIALVGEEEPACVIIKHTNPCGAGVASDIKEAFRKAWFDGDPLAAFGGVIVVNRNVSYELVKSMLSGKKFFEIVAAPSFDERARSLFQHRSRIQLWENKALAKPHLLSYEDIKKVRGGFLVQDGDIYDVSEKDLRVVTKRRPTKDEIEDLLFAIKIAQVCKSNAVVVVKGKTLLSCGVGQQDRKRCCELCVSKAVRSLKEAVAATDGFFPFRDGPDILIKAGIKAIAQPGGSIRDEEIIDACNKRNVAMVFTGVRGFRH